MRTTQALIERFSHLWPVPAALSLGVYFWLNAAKNGEHLSDLALEFAGTTARADAVVEGLDPAMVRATIVRDYVFLTLVFVAMAMAAAWVRRWYPAERGKRAGILFMWAALVGGLLDIVENTALLGYLGDWSGWGDVWPAVATIAASFKWAIVVCAGLYVAVGLGLAAKQLLRRSQTSA